MILQPKNLIAVTIKKDKPTGSQEKEVALEETTGLSNRLQICDR